MDGNEDELAPRRNVVAVNRHELHSVSVDATELVVGEGLSEVFGEGVVGPRHLLDVARWSDPLKHACEVVRYGIIVSGSVGESVGETAILALNLIILVGVDGGEAAAGACR